MEIRKKEKGRITIIIVCLVLGLPKMAAKSKYGLVFRDIRKLKAEFSGVICWKGSAG